VSRLVILGAGGLGREVHDVVEAVNGQVPASVDFLGFFDDVEPEPPLLVGRGPWLGPVKEFERLAQDVHYVIGIGTGSVRRTLAEWAESVGRVAAEPLIHPASTTGRHRVNIGQGSVLCAGARVTTNVTVGRHVIVNLNATIGHDAVIGDYVTLNPGASISGSVELAEEVNIGTGAAVIQGVTVGTATVIGAGASVVRDIPEHVTAVGVPARPRA
jgi:sugar O-acyltransferase (sialic acid O-acetyltransferase NeuD family)